MKHLIIVGASNFAREVFSWAINSREYKSEWDIFGFLSDFPNDLDGYDYPVSIIGTIKDYIPATEDLFVMAIADPAAKLQIAAQLEQRGANFITLIHPTVIIARNVKIGRGCVFCPYAVVCCDATIGNFVTMNGKAGTGHDTLIGDGCTLSSLVDVMGHVRLGKGVFLGSHACILPKIKVGEFATVGAGSIVVKTVKPRTTVFGNPAKTITTNNTGLETP